MIEFKELTKEYGGEVLLQDLTFKVNPRERCGLVGRNGSGKSTLLRLITREITPDGGAIVLPKSYTLGYLAQHLHFTHATLLDEAIASLKPEEKEMDYKAKKILFGLGFKEEDLSLSPHQFSGGYQLRIHLAKVLIQEPDCLLLDEPTNYLDIVSIRWFTRFLKAWRGEFILISHDRDFMDSVTTHTLGIHRKKAIKVEGGTEKFYTQLLEKEELHEKTRINLDKKRAELESFITRFGAKASKASQAQSKAKMLQRMPVLDELAELHNLNFKFPTAPFPGRTLLTAKNLSFSYEKANGPLISDLSFEISKEDRIAVIGKNGRGKSTLLRLMAQELKPDSGEIILSTNTKIGFFGQTNIERLNPKMTVEEEIAQSAPHHNVGNIRRICGLMMFPKDHAKKQIHLLSGGERSRVLLGKIIASPANLLLLDEPTNHLDMESIEALVRALDVFEGAIVIVTHSERILRELPTRFIICHQGNQHLFMGDYDQFLEKEGWESGDSAQPVKKTGGEKEDRRKRGEEIQRRSELLSPLTKEMKETEAEIIQLEKENAKKMETLIEASHSGDGLAITRLSKEIDERKKRIDQLFEKMEELSLLLEKRRRELH